MSKKEKLKESLLTNPSSFKWNDLCVVLVHCGFISKPSKDGMKFYHPKSKKLLQYHKPHPGNEVKKYVIKESIAAIKEL